MICELLCTGWYSSGENRTYQTFGDEFIRSRDFRPLWWKSVDTFIQPRHVLVVDSASPVKPNDSILTNTDCKYIELLNNPGHSQNCKAHYCGYMASVILGIEYALNNDIDIFLYVEQDALVFGEDIYASIVKKLTKKNFVFGNGGRFQDIEQSVFALNKKGMRQFIAALHSINYTDRQIQPEFKFMYAASKINNLPLIGLMSWDNTKYVRRLSTLLFQRVIHILKNYELLSFGYGRLRPINFDDPMFYFQQASMEELRIYRNLTGF